MDGLLRRFAQALPSTLIIELDDNNILETKAVVMAQFQARLKNIETVEGDRFYGRNGVLNEEEDEEQNCRDYDDVVDDHF